MKVIDADPIAHSCRSYKPRSTNELRDTEAVRSAIFCCWNQDERDSRRRRAEARFAMLCTLLFNTSMEAEEPHLIEVT